MPDRRGFSRPRRRTDAVGRFPWSRLTTCLAIPASTVLLASTTGGATTVARFLGQPGAAAPIFASPGSPAGDAKALKPAVEIPASALDEANGARRFSMSSVLMSAYQEAVDQAPASCHLSVPLLAAIGQVESGSLVGRTLDADHRVTQPVLGPVLDGNGFAAVKDTDDGTMDGDATWDRAMGPMQFIPSTWRAVGVDGDGDGTTDPQDVDDAAASAAAYLCADGRDLSTEDGVRDAVLSYNNSQAYYYLVLRWKTAFENASSLVVEEPDTASAAVSVVAGAMLSETLAPTAERSAAGPSAAPRPSAARIHASGASGPALPSASPSGSPSTSPSGLPTSSPTGSPSSSPVAPSPSTGPGSHSPEVPGPSTGTPSPTGPSSPTDPGSSPSGPKPPEPTTDPTPTPTEPAPSPTDPAPDCVPVDPSTEEGSDSTTIEGDESSLGDSASADKSVEGELSGDGTDDGEAAGDETDDGCPDGFAPASDGAVQTP